MKLNAPLTMRQQQVLDFMRSFLADNDQLPTHACIAKRFGWKSDNAALTFTKILEAKGYLERNTLGKYRLARPAPASPSAAFVALPVVSRKWHEEGPTVAVKRASCS
ncbi:MAG: hypothetical protein LCH79_16410 [Proteobacteria bacterium]|nr:hypothetical protein [Pseudomonadota bacterium]